MSFCRGCIVKSFHCHRRAYEGLMNEGASVRNTLPPLPLLPLQYLPKLSGLVPSLPALPFSDQPRCTRQPPRLQPLVESAPGFFLFSVLNAKKNLQMGPRGVSPKSWACRTGSCAKPLSVLSSGMYRPPALTRQTAAAAARCKGGEGRKGELPLWETFVTSMTAPLDGWAASIWLQCM